MIIRACLVQFYLLLFIAFGFVGFQSDILALEASNSGKISISYPISTLGNCKSLEDCRAYCEDEVNRQACTAFGIAKGFYKAPAGSGNSRSRLVLERAKSELGCSSDEDCKRLCQKEASKQKCTEFAKKYNLLKKKEIKKITLEQAKAALGCTDEGKCLEFCLKEENVEKCSEFAKRSGLRGGTVKIAPISEFEKQGFEQVKKIIEECKSDPEKCTQNFAQIEALISKQSNEFCRVNPDKCKESLERDVLKIASKSPEVQGVSTSRSIIDQIYRFLFR